MIPKKIYIDDNITNKSTFFVASNHNYRNIKKEYISVDALKEWVYCNYGAEDFMEKFEEFIKEEK
jgi:hypothetical protein